LKVISLSLSLSLSLCVCVCLQRPSMPLCSSPFGKSCGGVSLNPHWSSESKTIAVGWLRERKPFQDCWILNSLKHKPVVDEHPMNSLWLFKKYNQRHPRSCELQQHIPPNLLFVSLSHSLYLFLSISPVGQGRIHQVAHSRTCRLLSPLQGTAGSASQCPLGCWLAPAPHCGVQARPACNWY
jgi:hypothetical protein